MTDFADRYQDKIAFEPNTGCWIWTGDVTFHGYARAWDGKKQVIGHRLSYETSKGRIPDGLQIDHLCRVRSCVNPDHLEAVTQQENLRRGEGESARNSRKTHCPQGHPYKGKNVRHSKRKGGRIVRVCRTCHREKERARSVARRK